MYYYALSDSFAGHDPKAYTAGFANRKIVIAFPSRQLRDVWVATTMLLTARALTRQDAIKYAETTHYPKAYGLDDREWARVAQLYDDDSYIALRYSTH